MDLGLKGKVAIVTGGGSQIGYGKGVCLSLAREGCNVVVDDYDVNFEGALKTAEEARALGVESFAVDCDVKDRAQVDQLVKVTLEKFGKIDILVNNAGMSTPMVPFVKMTREQWDIDIQNNLYGQMNTCHAVLPHMIERRYGRVVNYAGGQGIPNNSSYGAAKAGVVAFSHSIAKEVGPLGVIVNIFSPGVGDTGLGGGSKALPPGFMEGIARRTLIGRLCTPNDVGPAVTFLCSDRCSYMVGGSLLLGAFGG